MKRLILTLLSISIFTISACDNELETNCIEVRLIADVCGNAVLQVVNESPDFPLGTWTDHNDNERVYDNVFGAFLNPCAENYPEDREDTFFVVLSDSLEQTNCVVCLALPASMPEQFYHVRIVEPCQQNSMD